MESDYEVIKELTIQNILEEGPCVEGFKEFLGYLFDERARIFPSAKVCSICTFLEWAEGKGYLTWLQTHGFIKKKEPEYTFELKDRFKIDNRVYTLYASDSHTYSLINTESGNSWSGNKHGSLDLLLFKELVSSSEDWVEVYKTKNKF